MKEHSHYIRYIHGKCFLGQGQEGAQRLLICGEKDKAGSAKSYNKKWHQRDGLPLKWIKNAGHNSNTDQPDEVNRLIEKFFSEVDGKGVSG